MRKLTVLVGLLALAVGSGLAQQPPQGGQSQQGGQAAQGRAGGAGQQARDRAPIPQGTASIAGRILTADTGRPLKRARVFVTGTGRGGHSDVTDDQGRYQVTNLPADTYTITASKAGFVDAIYGQRRPQQPGTPVDVADNQAIANIDVRLVRGGVITGRVLDEDGEALARALVTVQRYQYVRGERQLTPAGGDQTDDRGQYRVFGLPPGEYYVSAATTGLGEMLGRGLQQLAAGLAGGRGRGMGPEFGPFGGGNDSETSGYAPTYYPGVVNAPEAGKVTVAAGQEVAGLDFQIQLVPFARVSGVVAGSDEAVSVFLAPQDSSGALGRLGGQILTGRTQAGSFTITNVPPGRYLAIARSGGRSNSPKTGMQPIVVNGQNVDGVTIGLQSPVSLSGTIAVDSSGTPPTDYSGFRVDVAEVDPLPIGGGRGGPFGGGRADKSGTFRVDDLLPGRHYIRVGGQAAGQMLIAGQVPSQAQWTLKSISVGGQDVTDVPIDIKPGQNVENVSVVMTDQFTELSGAVRDSTGAGVSALTVIAFSSDRQYWRPQSRRIQTARTDSTGAYKIRGLPPGDYLIIAADDVEQGEWFDPAYLEQVQPGAKALSLSEGQKTTLDLKGPGA